jgi:hypothetical protein
MDGTEAALAAVGASRNTSTGGRVYVPSKAYAYGFPVKLEVAVKYENLKNTNENGQPPSARVLAEASQCLFRRLLRRLLTRLRAMEESLLRRILCRIVPMV